MRHEPKRDRPMLRFFSAPGPIARRLLSMLVLLVALVSWQAPARAVYQCDGETNDCQCGGSNPYPCCDNGGGNAGNCTWGAWNMACCTWGVHLPPWGNANTWAPNASNDANYTVQSTPVVNSIACANLGTYGHVAWVTSVNGTNIDVREMNCCSGCNNGYRPNTYSSDWFSQGFIVRAGCPCGSGDTQTQSCGNCGTQTRGCSDGCHWDNWSGCSGEGVCAQGQQDSKNCGDCGTTVRTCDNQCQWGDWSSCQGPDPGSGHEECDTGQQGVCSFGIRRCINGNLTCEQTTQSSDEMCDGLDNNCDGQTDENGICGTDASVQNDGNADRSVPSDGSSDNDALGSDGNHGRDAATGHDGSLSGIHVRGGCACRTTSAIGRNAGHDAHDHDAPWLFYFLGLLGLVGLVRRRRPRRLL